MLQMLRDAWFSYGINKGSIYLPIYLSTYLPIYLSIFTFQMSKKMKKMEKEAYGWKSRFDGCNKALVDMVAEVG